MATNAKILTKVNSFTDVQKSLQEIEKKLNELSKATNTEAEGEVSDKDGKTGDIRTTRNEDGTYTFEIKTKEGWKTPALGDSLIKFKDKLSSFRQTTPKGIEDIVTSDDSSGGSEANLTTFDEKNNKFILARPDYNSGWFQIETGKQYVTGATTGVAPDTSFVYDAAEVVGIPSLNFEFTSPPSHWQIHLMPPGASNFNDIDVHKLLILDNSRDFYVGFNNYSTGINIMMTSKSSVCLSTGANHLIVWGGASDVGGNQIQSDSTNWYQAFTSSGTSGGQATCRLLLWK